MRADLSRELPTAAERRLLVLVEEIQSRLAPICTETPTDLFNDMVLRIAHVQLRFELNPPR